MAAKRFHSLRLTSVYGVHSPRLACSIPNRGHPFQQHFGRVAEWGTLVVVYQYGGRKRVFFRKRLL